MATRKKQSTGQPSAAGALRAANQHRRANPSERISILRTDWDAAQQRIRDLEKQVAFVSQERDQAIEAGGKDGLTGAYNRAGFERVFAQELSRLKRGNQGKNVTDKARSTIFLIDLDKFKPVNDVFGHGAGDAVLVGVVDAFQKNVRPEDAIFRFGGDEIGGLLSNTKGAGAEALGSRVKEFLDAHRVTHKSIKGTLDNYLPEFSLGAVEFDETYLYKHDGTKIVRTAHEGHIKALIDIADQMMYEEKTRKKAGRDNAADLQGPN